MPHAISSPASPTGAASQVQSGRPQTARMPWPTTSEAATISAAEAIAAIKGRYAEKRAAPAGTLTRSRSASSSATWTALVAAPLRRLSPTTQRLRQRS